MLSKDECAQICELLLHWERKLLFLLQEYLVLVCPIIADTISCLEYLYPVKQQTVFHHVTALPSHRHQHIRFKKKISQHLRISKLMLCSMGKMIPYQIWNNMWLNLSIPCFGLSNPKDWKDRGRNWRRCLYYSRHSRKEILLVMSLY